MSLKELEFEHLHLLVRDMTLGKVVLFTGAGLFASAGLPSWKDILTELIDRYDEHCNDVTRSAVADVARSESMVRRLRRRMDEGPKHYEQIAQVCATNSTCNHTNY